MSERSIPDPEALLRDFRNAIEPEGGFGHLQHVYVAWRYLKEDSLGRAIDAFCEDLIRFATAQGMPDKPHMTMTWALMVLLHERMSELPGDHVWEQFCDANPDLLSWNASLLGAHYSPELLKSERARRMFVLPDRTSLRRRPPES